MPETIISPEWSDQDEDTEFDDIESELYSSAREACVAYFPFANLDLTRARWSTPSCETVWPHVANTCEIDSAFASTGNEIRELEALWEISFSLAHDRFVASTW